MAAFEQSLGNMTIRLQSLTMTAEQKVKQKGCSFPPCLALATNLKILFSFIPDSYLDFIVLSELLELNRKE